MSVLHDICSYWYECISKEDVLEKDISIYVRSKAVLYPFAKDSFIFQKKLLPVETHNEKIIKLVKRQKTNEEDMYYGYPLMFYYDEITEKYLLAPLLIIRLDTEVTDEGGIILTKAEPTPLFGMQALSRLGLRTEEIAEANKILEKLFKSDVGLTDAKIVKKVLDIIQSEANLAINEEIDPYQLTNFKEISKTMNAGLYNKSMLFLGESSLYNMHLLKDLSDLQDKKDLDKTSLSYLVSLDTLSETERTIPILPFRSNEYQVVALSNIKNNKVSIITGPPGTGKSQFIINLIINLFLNKKKVLFVSHTGEAVDVVNTKINSSFRNLMMRTGKKEFRRALLDRYEELIEDYSNHKKQTQDMRGFIESKWRHIEQYRESLLYRDQLEQDFEDLSLRLKRISFSLESKGFSFRKIIDKIRLYFGNKDLQKRKSYLAETQDRKEMEEEIKKLEDDYYESSYNYVREAYIDLIVGNGLDNGAINTFLNEVNEHRYDAEQRLDQYIVESLNSLRIWSTTLKSLRATFPLEPNIFDYVIFDEASQIDLPSAAPALYRAKRAVVVGDPMQLTHIAGITRKVDSLIAKKHRLEEEKDLYPSKIRYCDVSLYKSVANSIANFPIFLADHYRSEDEIISLCNKVFYKGKLKVRTSFNNDSIPKDLPKGLHWIDVPGTVYKHPSGSRYNPEEVKVVVEEFKKLWKIIEKSDLKIGVVTPYSRQRQEIYNGIKNFLPEDEIGERVRILTAHKFQGSEADVIIFSLVLATNGDGGSDLWYNNYPQILNVGLSRARITLYIVGDKHYASSRHGILGSISKEYDNIKNQRESAKRGNNPRESFDTLYEREFFNKLKSTGIEEKYNCRLIPQYDFKRYTLDIAILGKRKICIELDGKQHEVIDGVPVIEDVKRDEYLRSHGWVVFRIPNYRVVSEPDLIIKEVEDLLVKYPTSDK